MRFWCFAALAALMAGGSVAAAAPAPVAVLKLEPYRKSVAVRVALGGKERLFTFDSAGGITIISPALAKAIGCEPWGQVVGHQMTGNRLSNPRCDNVPLKIGAFALNASVVGVMDVTPLIAKDAEPVDGLLALDLFDGQTVTIDAAAGALTVESPESLKERLTGARELPMRLSRELGGLALAANVAVATPRGPILLELDTGNGGTILVSKPYARLLGLDPDAPGPQKGAFDVAPGIRAEGVMFTPDMIIDGNLGMPFLKDWAVTLDLKAGRMWIQRSKATPPPGMGVPPPLPN